MAKKTKEMTPAEQLKAMREAAKKQREAMKQLQSQLDADKEKRKAEREAARAEKRKARDTLTSMKKAKNVAVAKVRKEHNKAITEYMKANGLQTQKRVTKTQPAEVTAQSATTEPTA